MQNGILKDVNKIIDEILGVTSIGKTSPHYRHKEPCDQLNRFPLKKFAADLLNKVYDQIENNWKGRVYKKYPSKENWRFKPNTRIDPRNKSLEIQLQRAIVQIEKNMLPDARKWTNHVPTASGLWDHAYDKHRAIDLAHVHPGQNRYDTVEFIELKVNRIAGHPVYAAIEVLLYGMLYIFSRRHLEELNYGAATDQQPLLRAKAIHLVVLAPFEYYDGYQFEWLEGAITTELGKFIKKPEGYTMDFQFQAFPQGCSISKIISDEALLIKALNNRIRQQWRDEADSLECKAGGALAAPRLGTGKSKRGEPRLVGHRRSCRGKSQ